MHQGHPNCGLVLVGKQKLEHFSYHMTHTQSSIYLFICLFLFLLYCLFIHLFARVRLKEEAEGVEQIEEVKLVLS